MLTNDIGITFSDVWETRKDMYRDDKGVVRFIMVGYNDKEDGSTVDNSGLYTYNGITYKYKVALLGKGEDEEELSTYTVFTNKEDITYEYIHSNADRTDEEIRKEFVVIDRYYYTYFLANLVVDNIHFA